MSRSSPARVRACGFTLIEILVVLAIVAVMVVAVGLSVDSGGPARRVATEAQRLAALMQLACDESAQFGQEVGVRFDPEGYVFLRAVGREWEARTSDALRARRLPTGMQLDLQIGERPIELDGDEDDGGDAPGTVQLSAAGSSTPSRASTRREAFEPHLVCDTDGALTAADVRIGIKAGERGAALTVGDDGALQVTDGGRAP